MTVSFALPQDLWDRLVGALADEHETAWTLLARQVGNPATGDLTLLVRDAVDVPDAAYEARTWNRLSITADGWFPTFARADFEDCIPIFVHTHPGGAATYSSADDLLDQELARVADVRLRHGSYGSLVLGVSDGQPDFVGRLSFPEQEWRDVDRLRVTGQRLSLFARDASAPLPIFDRQIRAFGEDGQRVLKQLRVGIVGAGGTGSAIAEQLTRLGVGDVVVIDPQDLADTNVTRVYGSSIADEGRSKAEVAAENVHRIGLGTSVTAVRGSVLDRNEVEALVHCDVIFGCTDDHASRLLLTRLPQAFLQLLIDCGVVLDSREEVLFDIFARVTVVTPTSACLMCTDDVDPRLAAIESLPEHEREALAREGYAPELNNPDPSVVTFTTLAASLAVNELLSRLFGYAEEDPANRLVARVGSREFSRSRHHVRGNHRCGKRELLAAGLAEPFLDYGWAQ